MDLFGQDNFGNSWMNKIKRGVRSVLGKNFEGLKIYNLHYKSYFPDICR